MAIRPDYGQKWLNLRPNQQAGMTEAMMCFTPLQSRLHYLQANAHLYNN